ncbi:protein PFC0760c-like [Leptopilina boulardi]|uniref:protein PFC0760c-like n=1 Tax=Leptopilina boulardi TaxID=63433 RepID=UPI0021F625B2|nr:protein PFC0760c-like [Leptopilina boulardi]
MGERSKGKLSHASSYGSSGPDRFHPQEAYWKNHRGNNPSISNCQRDRRQAGGTENQTFFIPDNRKLKSNSQHPNYQSVQNSDPLFRQYQNYKSYRNKNGLINNAGISRKGKDFKEDAENDADDDDEDDDELGDDDNDYYENETNAKEDEEDNQVESSVSCETIEKNNEDPSDDVEENYISSNYRNKFEKFPSSMMEKLKMLDFAHALKMNQQRRMQKKYPNTTQRDCQDMQNQDCTDEVTEDDDEIPQRQFRKSQKQSINNSNNYRQPNNSWLSRDHDNYHLIRSQQMYNYPKKYDIKQTTLDPNLMEYYSKKRPCRYCGGTGSDLIEPAITRKINCRVHDSAKVNFNTKEKFDGESGDPGERYISGRRNSPKINLLNISPTNFTSQKSRRSRNTRSPERT